MKPTIFQGKEYLVPNWAKYIAQDKDGKVCAYQNEPMKSDIQGVYVVFKGLWRNIVPVQNEHEMICEEIK
jgi:hypothetical protein